MKKVTYIIISLLVYTSTYSQEDLSLSDAIRIGMENNYELKVTRNKEEVASINNTWGNTGALPNINFNASVRENYNINDLENYRTQTISPDLSLNWMIFNGFSARINKERFEQLEEQSKGNTAVLVENTIQDIILAYYNCLLQKEYITVYKELVMLSEDRYNRSKESQNMGSGTTYETMQAKTAWLEDQSNYLKQQVAYENAIRTLNFILAAENNTKWNLTTLLEIEITEYNLADMEQKLKENNATLKNQYLYQSLLAKETSLAKNSYYPSLSLIAGTKNTDLSNYFDGQTPDNSRNFSDAYVGVTLSWNIFNGGAKKRSLQIAKINEESSHIKTDQMIHSLNNQLLQLFSTHQINKTVLELASDQEASAKLNLELSEAKLKNGSINSFNYRDVQIMYMNAAMNKLRAIYSLIQSNTDLLRITGGIVESEINQQ